MAYFVKSLCAGGAMDIINREGPMHLKRWKTSVAAALNHSPLGIQIKKEKFYYAQESTLEERSAALEPSVAELLQTEESLNSPDYFQVHKMFTVKDLFDAKVHLGHKMGALNPRMADFVFGSRFDHCFIDLDKTAFHLRQALNFLAHVAYRKGIILFVTRSPHTMQLVEHTAIECGEYAHCREWDLHTLTDSPRKFGGITRLPDTIVLLNTLDTVMARHRAIPDAAKMLIPTVGVVDTNCDPNLITYPIPGNDDTPSAIELYCRLIKEALARGKNKRKQVDALKLQNDNKPVSESNH